MQVVVEVMLKIKHQEEVELALLEIMMELMEELILVVEVVE